MVSLLNAIPEGCQLGACQNAGHLVARRSCPRGSLKPKRQRAPCNGESYSDILQLGRWGSFTPPPDSIGIREPDRPGFGQNAGSVQGDESMKRTNVLIAAICF